MEVWFCYAYCVNINCKVPIDNVRRFRPVHLALECLQKVDASVSISPALAAQHSDGKRSVKQFVVVYQMWLKGSAEMVKIICSLREYPLTISV